MSKDGVYTWPEVSGVNSTVSNGVTIAYSTSTDVGNTYVTYSGGNVVVTRGPTTTPDTRAMTNAVYGYIQAVRALDRTDVSVTEISSALALPPAAVINALKNLKEKGVKFKT
jgi:hypothetical protein